MCFYKVNYSDDRKTHFITVEIKYKDTTCSLPAFKRGFGQKVVGFSIYGDLSSNKSRTKGKY